MLGMNARGARDLYQMVLVESAYPALSVPYDA